MTAQPENPTKCKAKAECRLRQGSTICLPIGWTPVYDGYGKLMNHDPSSYSTFIGCNACGGRWYRTIKSGETTWCADTKSTDSQSL